MRVLGLSLGGILAHYQTTKGNNGQFRLSMSRLEKGGITEIWPREVGWGMCG